MTLYQSQEVKFMKRKFRFAPLSGGFMAMSMIGFLISVFYVYNNWPDWGVAFAAAFIVMFIASVISMTYAPADEFIELEERTR